MARTRGAEADPVGLVEEEFTLGPEDEPTLEDEATQAGEDEAGGGGAELEPEFDDDGNPIEPEPEPEDEVAVAPKRGGGSEAVRAQRRRAQEAETRAAALERENAELRGFQAGVAQRQPADPQAAARAEQEFYQSLEMMPPAQAYQALMQRGQQQIGSVIQGIEFRTNDRADKAAYDAAARADPIYKKYQAQVEQVLAEERRQGRNPDREVILDVLYGREMRQRSRAAAGKQRPAAAARVAGQRTQPTGARGDVAARGRRPAPGSLEADLALVNAAIARGESVF